MGVPARGDQTLLPWVLAAKGGRRGAGRWILVGPGEAGWPGGPAAPPAACDVRPNRAAPSAPGRVPVAARRLHSTICPGRGRRQWTAKWRRRPACRRVGPRAPSAPVGRCSVRAPAGQSLPRGWTAAPGNALGADGRVRVLLGPVVPVASASRGSPRRPVHRCGVAGRPGRPREDGCGSFEAATQLGRDKQHLLLQLMLDMVFPAAPR